MSSTVVPGAVSWVGDRRSVSVTDQETSSMDGQQETNIAPGDSLREDENSRIRPEKQDCTPEGEEFDTAIHPRHADLHDIGDRN